MTMFGAIPSRAALRAQSTPATTPPAPPAVASAEPSVEGLLEIFAEAEGMARHLVDRNKAMEEAGERIPAVLLDAWRKDAALTLARMADGMDLLRASLCEVEEPPRAVRQRG